MKIDIEGKEYDLLNNLIDTGAISYIDKIYCEWHYHKMRGYKKNKKKFQKKHDSLVSKLNDLGFKLTGHNLDDELDYIMKRQS